MIKFFINQKERLLINIINIALLFCTNYFLLGTFIPQFNNNGLWFLCCFLNIILANQLLTPYFTKPVDSISFSVTCLVSIIMIKSETTWNILSLFSYIFIIIYTTIIIISSIICILLKDHEKENLRNISERLKIIISVLGTAKVIFSMLFLFSLLTYHSHNSKEILILCLVYLLFIIQSPVNELFLLIKKMFIKNKLIKNIIDFGEIAAYQDPNIILIRQQAEVDIPYMTGIIIKDQYSLPKLGYSLDYIGKSNGILLRTFIFEKTDNTQILNDIKELPLNSAMLVNTDYFSKKEIFFTNKKIIGLVTIDTSNEYLCFELIIDEDIEIGTLVCTKIKEKEIIFQIINGKTKEDIIQNKNTHGYINVIARKIGEWDNIKYRFIPSNWLPKINSEVTKCIKDNEYNPKELSIPIGNFPNSDYSILLEDLNSLVTHNTAILGVLGVGKSMLSIELVERLLSQDIKVIVLDLTNQYQSELEEFLDTEYEKICIAKLQEAGEKDKDTWAPNTNKGGSIVNFVEALHLDIEDLLNNNKNRNLKIYNPSQLFATRQYHEPKSYNNEGNWNRDAQLYALTPVEITKIVSEVALTLISDEMRDTAKLCLVLEEAHSLIPEFGSIVVETDKHATNGTARAILQGRKYGFGCIVISQRTANVTKTILNQCNSIFAMRTFDDTGKDFLSNYIGKEYTDILSSLNERHAVYFGKSSSCENPVLIRLNDREKFLSEYRKQYPVKEIIKEKSQGVDNGDVFVDDIPF